MSRRRSKAAAMGAPRNALPAAHAASDLFCDAPPFAKGVLPVWLGWVPDEMLSGLPPHLQKYVVNPGKEPAKVLAALEQMPVSMQPSRSALMSFLPPSMNKPLESDELRKQFRDTARLVEKAGKVVEAALGLSASVACTVEKKRPFTTGPSNGTIKLIESPPNETFATVVTLTAFIDAGLLDMSGSSGVNTVECQFNPTRPLETWRALVATVPVEYQKVFADSSKYALVGGSDHVSGIGVVLRPGCIQGGGHWVKVAKAMVAEQGAIPLRLVRASEVADAAKTVTLQVANTHCAFQVSVLDDAYNMWGPMTRSSSTAIPSATMVVQRRHFVKHIPERRPDGSILPDGTAVPEGVSSAPLSQVLDTQALVADKLGGGTVAADPDSRFWRIAIVPNVYVAPKQNGVGAKKMRDEVVASFIYYAIYHGLTVSYQYFSTVLHLYGGISYSAGTPKQTWSAGSILNEWVFHLMVGILLQEKVCLFCDTIMAAYGRKTTSTNHPVKNKIDQHLKKYFILETLKLLPDAHCEFCPDAVVRYLRRSPAFLEQLRCDVRADGGAIAKLFLSSYNTGDELRAQLETLYCGSSERNKGLWQAFERSSDGIGLLIKGLHVAVAEWVDERVRSEIVHDTILQAPSMLCCIWSVLKQVGINQLSSHYSRMADPMCAPGKPWFVIQTVRDLAPTACREVEVLGGAVQVADHATRCYQPWIAQGLSSVFLVASDAVAAERNRSEAALQAMGLTEVCGSDSNGIRFSAIAPGQQLPDVLLLDYDTARVRHTCKRPTRCPAWMVCEGSSFFDLVTGYGDDLAQFEDHLETLAKPGHKVTRFTTWDLTAAPIVDDIAADLWLQENIMLAPSVVTYPKELHPYDVPIRGFGPCALKMLGYFFVHDDGDGACSGLPTYHVPIPVCPADGEEPVVYWAFFVFYQDSVTAPLVLISQPMTMGAVDIIRTSPREQLVTMLLDPRKMQPYERVEDDEPQAALTERGEPAAATSRRRTYSTSSAYPSAPFKSCRAFQDYYSKALSTSKISMASDSDTTVIGKFKDIIRGARSRRVTGEQILSGMSKTREYFATSMEFEGYRTGMIDYIFGEEAAAALRRERMIDEGRALVARDAAADVAHSEYLALIANRKRKASKALCDAASAAKQARFMLPETDGERSGVQGACIDMLLEAADDLGTIDAAYKAVEDLGKQL